MVTTIRIAPTASRIPTVSPKASRPTAIMVGSSAAPAAAARAGDTRRAANVYRIYGSVAVTTARPPIHAQVAA